MSFDRRDFLRFGALGSAGFLTRRLQAAANAPLLGSSASISGNPARKLLVVFLRGGNDGVNTVVPFGDTTYSTVRPTLNIPTSSLLAIPGSTFAGLHPALLRLQPVMAAGDIAFLHAIGTDQPSRSHFVEMQKLETAQEAPPTALAQEGFVPRLLEGLYGSGQLPTPAGVSISRLMQRMFLSVAPERILTHVRSARDFSFGDLTPYRRLKGAAPWLLDPLGDAFWGTCSFGDATPSEVDDLIRTTGVNACEAETAIQTQVADHLYGANPQHDAARYPTSPTEVNALGLTGAELAALTTGQSQNFMRELEEAMTTLRNTGANVVGVELGAFDTHQQQLPTHERLLHILGFGLGSLHADIVAANLNDLAVLVVTEFGRTSYENASAGTDHGVGTVCMFLGRQVNGGVYNCARTGSLQFGAPWRALGAAPLNPIYADAVEPQTHFQTVIAEVCERHFGMAATDVNLIVPGINQQVGRLYRRLGFL